MLQCGYICGAISGEIEAYKYLRCQMGVKPQSSHLFAAKDTCASCQLSWYNCVTIEAQMCYIGGVKEYGTFEVLYQVKVRYI